jgi:predicted GNAT family acetyltransferase
MVSVAQTDFENSDFALIVGVATDPKHQGKGYGRSLMESLCKALADEGKTLYLQYDSPVAGSLYESMGFETVEQIMHIKNLAYNR